MASCALAAAMSFAEAPRNPATVLLARLATPVTGSAAPDLRGAARSGKAATAQLLRDAFSASTDPYVRLWADAVGQRDDRVLDSIPDSLLASYRSVPDSALRSALLSARYQAPTTAPYVYPTNGIPPPSFKPTGYADLMPPDTFALITAWSAAHLPYLLECARAGSTPLRGRIPTLVITQDMLYAPARGVVWQMSAAGLIPADFNALPHVLWNTEFLATALAEYPDQELVSFVTRGAATKSEAAGLTAVFGPHLISLAAGFAVVSDSIDEMIVAGKYCISSQLPYFPFFGLPQGSTAKGDDGLDKRRITDGGCPRKETTPPAMSLNTASRLAPWVPEVKPTVGAAARDLAVLSYAASVWDTSVYFLSDDFVAFFTQFHRHGSELWKSGFFWHQMEAPAWVVEYVLGFGLVPSSNIAQRFSHAILWILFARIDAEEAALLKAEVVPARVSYLADRRALGPHQDALYAAHIFTDDPLFIIVGTERTVRITGHLGQLCEETRAILSNGRKMQVGTSVKWSGIYFCSHLALVVVPPHKVLRAIATLRLVVNCSFVAWCAYQSLCGLLEHVRYALSLRRSAMYGMYAPYRALGGRLAAPAEPVPSTLASVTRSASWITDLQHRPGSHCADVVRAAHTPLECAPADGTRIVLAPRGSAGPFLRWLAPRLLLLLSDPGLALRLPDSAARIPGHHCWKAHLRPDHR